MRGIPKTQLCRILMFIWFLGHINMLPKKEPYSSIRVTLLLVVDETHLSWEISEACVNMGVSKTIL